MPRSHEFDLNPPLREWETYFKDLGVKAEFSDLRNVFTAFKGDFEPGIYIVVSPIRPDDASDDIFIEELLNEILDDLFYKVFGWETNETDSVPPNLFPDKFRYDEEGKLLFRIKEGKVERGPSKNTLPL